MKTSQMSRIARVAMPVAGAIIVVGTGVARLPELATTVEHSPVVVLAAAPMTIQPSARRPLLSGSARFIRESASRTRATVHEALRMRSLGIVDPSRFKRAVAGEEVSVTLTQYCLRGTTRRGRVVRPGILAADPRIFPLARYVDVYMEDKYLGRYLVDDTGGNVIGATLDIWTPSCRQATRFGRQKGKAILVARNEEDIPPDAELEIGDIPDLTAVAEILEGPAKR